MTNDETRMTKQIQTGRTCFVYAIFTTMQLFPVNHKLAAAFALVFCGMTGCAARPPANLASSPITSVVVNPKTEDVPGRFDQESPLPGHGLGDISSHIFGIEGRVVRIDRDGPLLKSITFDVIKPLPAALGWQPMEKSGEQVVVHFDTETGSLEALGITPNTVTDLYYGQLDGPGQEWASNLAWLCFWKDGQCYRIDSAKTSPADSSPDGS
jgi:hypothetical protein